MKTFAALFLAAIPAFFAMTVSRVLAGEHVGSIHILTTPDGANLPASAVERDFPLLVRLNANNFDFSTAKPDGGDVRFFDSEGTPLASEIDEWDAKKETAAVWVKIPTIKGNSDQEVKVKWGETVPKSAPAAGSVFGESNGYLSVWHMDAAAVADDVGTLPCKDTGTTPVAGIIGTARHFAGKQGIFCGDKIPNYPVGGSAHSTEAWFRAEQSNATIIGWGNEGGGRGSKVRIQLRGPTHVHIDSDFSDVNAPAKLPIGQWIHVVHTYADGRGCIYINGQLAGEAKTTLNIKTPSRLWLGGWYNNYDFVGDLDEVRISNVVRSADWIRLEYENQKPLQTLVGSLVREGTAFSVSQDKIDLPETQSATIPAEAGGAEKVYWILKRDGDETVAAVDQLAFTLNAGRVVADSHFTLEFKAIYPGGNKTRDIAVTVHKEIPDPMVTLQSPAAWNGRDTIEVVPMIANRAAMKAKGAGDLKFAWSVIGGAVTREILPDRLILKRSQYTGPITIMAAIDNGGSPTIASATIVVTEPKKDPWIVRVPDKNEQPVDNQFIPRDDRGDGTLYYNGTLEKPADSVFLNLYADEKLVKTDSQKPAADGSYAFTIKLKPGLIHYKVEFGSKTANAQTVLNTVRNVVCGDAYIIAGQSNAVADVKDNPETSEWIRSFGNMNGGNGKGWANAVRGSAGGDLGRIGYWGFDVARELSTRYSIPICIINGAVGGTRVDQHQPNPQNHADPETIYGKLHSRILAAKLTHGIRGLLWYQGENNQGANCPTGDDDWKSYQQYFVDLSAAWKQDYPNLQHYYVLQFWPNSCSMGGTHAGDMTGETIRTLPSLYSNMRMMSVLGVVSPGSGHGNCHFAWQGYAQIATLVTPMIENDDFGLVTEQAVTAPSIKKAWFTNAARTELAMEFDQPMTWNDATKSLLYLDDLPAEIAGGKTSGPLITLQLAQPSEAHLLTYVKGKDWDGKQSNLLYGSNKIAALTFCDVPISKK